MTALSRELLAALAEDLRLPPAWRAAAAASAPTERPALLAQVRRQLLVATPASRARLRAWLDRRRLEPGVAMPAWLLVRWIQERVLFYGDDSMLPAVVAALVTVPEPVREAALRETAFLAVGAESRAWTGSSNLVDRDGEPRPRMIVLSGAARHAEDLMRTVLHELGHGWAMPLPSVLLTAQGTAAFLDLAHTEGWRAVLDARAQREERLAVALAALWESSSTVSVNRTRREVRRRRQ